MSLVIVTTAIDYADFLSATLNSMKKTADACYVVTQKDDAAIDVSVRHGAEPVVFDGWKNDGAEINKAGAVRCGQAIAYEKHPDAWYLLVDADIVIPDSCRRVIEECAVDEHAMYGAKRLDYHTPQDVINGVPTKVYGSAWAGYFQLYKRHVFYPEWSRTCEGVDLAFSSQFSRCRALPITVAHIGMEYINWGGRVAPAWSSPALQMQ